MGGFGRYIASSFVFLTFYMRDMIPLRVVALCSNPGIPGLCGSFALDADLHFAHRAHSNQCPPVALCSAPTKASLAHSRELPMRPGRRRV